MKIKISLVWILFSLGKMYSLNTGGSYLILNYFENTITNVSLSLKKNFPDSKFKSQKIQNDFTKNLDIDSNPASLYMSEIKQLGENYNIDYVLFNRLTEKGQRKKMDYMLFKTKTGGLLYRSSLELIQYDNVLLNEINLFIDKFIKAGNKNWGEEREKILFSDVSEIIYEKTPFGAALRSMFFPGWGQYYSGNDISAGIWATTEIFLGAAFLISFNNYNNSANRFLQNSINYNNSNDQSVITLSRKNAEKDWDDHVLYSRLAIGLGGATIVGWISNTIHAWIFGPRPHTNIYQEGIIKTNLPER